MKTILTWGGRLLLAIVLLLGLWAWNSRPPPVDPEALRAGSQAYMARIIRDQWGIPHIYGKRDRDVAFGLAIAHAEDDFATIQDVILATRGRLAAEKGPAAAVTDYLIAFMGIWDAIETGYETDVGPEARALAAAYAAGLNHYAADHPSRVSGYAFPARGADLIAGFAFKTPLFYGFDRSLAAVIDGSYTGLVKDGDQALTVTTEPQPALGSQGIAVAPARATDGHTRLLVNSHQPLEGPVAWYEARLKSEEGWDIAGGTFPGSPIILHGAGPALGWASTVNQPDLVDVYRLEMQGPDSLNYRFDDDWVALEVRDVAITVRLFGPWRWTVREPLYRSAHGPVMKTDEGYFAFRWAGMGRIDLLDQMLAMNKARNLADFRQALERLALPSINYVYADKTGNIAHFYNAAIPRRLAKIDGISVDWQGVLPGDRSDLIWRDYVPFSDLPMTVNPASGFVFNANNTPFVSTTGDGQPKATDFPTWMGVDTGMTNRAHRIRRLLGDDPSISMAEFRAYKYDNLYDPASAPILALRAYLKMPPGAAVDATESAARALLDAWDGSTGRDSRFAALGVLTLSAWSRTKDGDRAMADALAGAIQHLITHFGRLDPPYGTVNRLRRGSGSWPLSGGPDVLRATYGRPDDVTGELIDRAGDSFILFADWDEQGALTIQAVHNYGSATLDEDSVHFADQAPLFAAEKERPVTLSLDALLAVASSDRIVTSGP